MKHEDKSETWKRGYMDCVQDGCENCPFASVGGLDARPNLIAPNYIQAHEAEEYLAGYKQAAIDNYGPDWATCTFSWQPALTIPGREQEGDPS